MPWEQKIFNCRRCGSQVICNNPNQNYCSSVCQKADAKERRKNNIKLVTFSEQHRLNLSRANKRRKKSGYVQISWNKGNRGLYHHSIEAKQKISDALIGNQWNVGKKLDVSTKAKISVAHRNLPPISDLTRKRISNALLGRKRPETSGDKNCNFGKVTVGTGRCKWFDYESPIAGKVKLQGTYELRMAKVLDTLQFSWARNYDRFIYDSGAHAYVPDFKIGRKVFWYMDTKGWFSDKEKEKISKVREENNIKLLIATLPVLKEYERSASHALANI
jgi:hypothetical protein